MKYFLLLLYTITLAVVFLCKPRPEGNWNGEYIHLKGNLGIFLSTDSYNFCREAEDIQSLFDTTSIRQDRPGYLVAVHLLSIPIGYLANKVEKVVHLKNKVDFNYLNNINERIISNPEFLVKKKPTYNIIVKYRHIYLSFVILNVILLFFTLIVFYDLLSKLNIDKSLKIACLILVSINRVTKAYILAAHMQIFILFTPILFMYSLYRLDKSNFATKEIIINSCFMGFLCLFYGSFVFYFPLLCITAIIYFKNIRNVLSKWLLFLLSGILCVFPSMLWIIALKKITGVYYNHEIDQFREYIWIKDHLSISLASFVITFIKFYIAYIICILKSVVFFILIYLLLLRYSQKQGVKTHKDDFFIQLNISIIVLSTFLLFLGFYQPRLTYLLGPILFTLIALLLQGLFNAHLLDKRKAITIVFVCLFLKSCYVILSNNFYQ